MDTPPGALTRRSWAPAWALLLVLVVAAALRLAGLNWDGGLGAHPDERYVVGVAESLRWPDLLNPLEIDPGYSYGHLPLYALALTRGLAPRTDPLLVGRVLAAAISLATVALTYVLGRQTGGRWVGLTAAGITALAPLCLQQARFYTADALLTLSAVAALIVAVRLAARGRGRDALLAGAFAGLAVGSKLTGALLALPLAAACVLGAANGAARGTAAWRYGLWCALGGLAAFAATNPFALVELGRFARNAAEQAAIARGALDVPYTRQFHGTWPYLYPAAQLLRWGLGVLPGLAALGGWGLLLARAVRRSPAPAEWVLLAWSAPTAAFMGGLYAKYPRYMLPVLPVFAICGARLLLEWAEGRLWPVQRIKGWLRWAPLTLVVGALLMRAVAYSAMLTGPHPWQSAAAYLREEVMPSSRVVLEEWDQPLLGEDSGSEVRVLPLYDADSEAKWVAAGDMLAGADYVVIASRRAYRALAGWPERYPLTARYYRLLFEGRLGFEPVACFGRAPRLGDLLAFVDDPAAGLGFVLPDECRSQAAIALNLGPLDESLVVYDHPQVIIFRRTATAPDGAALAALLSSGL